MRPLHGLIMSLLLVTAYPPAHAEDALPQESAPEQDSEPVQPSQQPQPSTSAQDEGTESRDSQSDKVTGEDEGDGLFGPYRFGPMLALQLPGANHLSLEGRFFRIFGASLGVGGFSAKAKEVNVSAGHIDVKARWFPFLGSFFLGLGLGTSAYKATLDKELTVSAAGVQKTAKTRFEAKIARSELTPMLGWQWILGPGFTIGLDFGAQLALQAKSELTIAPQGLSDAERAELEKTSDYRDARKKVKDDFLDAVKDASLPYLSLGLGWMF